MMATASAESQQSPQNPNDTQDLPTQVYRSYYSTRNQAGNLTDTFLTTGAITSQGESGPRTYFEGDTGHVALMQDYGEDNNNNTQDNDSQSNAGGSLDELAAESQLPVETVTSPTRFSPTTPAFAGRKHDRYGDPISSVHRTPATDLVAMFANHENKIGLGLSQLHEQTQGQSSPLPDHFGSEAVFERPSPTLANQFETSPTSSMTSSPRAPRTGLERAITDPQQVYIPIKDSQKRRQYKMSQEESVPRRTWADIEFGDVSEDESPEVTRLKARKRNLETRKGGLTGTRAPKNPPQRSGGRNIGKSATRSAVEPITPAIRRKGKSIDLCSDNPTPFAPENKEDNMSDEDENDQGGELKQIVISSEQIQPEMDDSVQLVPQTSSKMSDSASGNGMAETPLRPHSHNIPSNGNQAESEAKVEVANSQPGSLGTEGELVRQHDNEPPGMNSQKFIPQSPDDSSSIPMPPELPGPKSSNAHSTKQQSEKSKASKNKPGTIKQTVPETSPPAAPGSKDESNIGNMESILDGDIGKSSDVQADATNKPSNGTSISTAAFETAPSRQTPTGKRKRDAEAVSKSPSATPRTLRLRGVKAMAASSQPSASVNMYSDVNILDADDQEFVTAVSKASPVATRAKRPRRTYHSNVSSGSAEEVNSVAEMTTLLKDLQQPDVKVGAYINEPELKAANALAEVGQHDDELVNARILRDDGVSDRQEIIPISVKRRPPKRLSKSKAKDNLVERDGDEVPKARRSSEPPELDVKSNIAIETSKTLAVENEGQEKEVESLPFPRRVLARFRGLQLHFFPATCIGQALSESGKVSYTVRFDDGTVDNGIPESLVKRFELRVGDLVKVYLPKWRDHVYAVDSFKDLRLQSSDDVENEPKTDVFGYETVVLRRKVKEDVYASPQDVAMADIYITSSGWKIFADRKYEHIKDDSEHSSRLQTPLSSTPSGRRHVSRSTLLAQSHQIFDAVKSETKFNLFGNMAFVITYSDAKQDQRKRIEELVTSHGGRILADGFEELFDIPADSTADFGSGDAHQQAKVEMSKFRLATSSENLGFTAVLTDKHSRRKKFLQALALDVPCLAGKWVLDCVERKQVLPWSRYLLPAGESSFLGAVHSRTFANQAHPSNALDARLAQTIELGPRLLLEKSVILVLGSVKEVEKKQAHSFLSHALGASRVTRVKDVQSAKKLLDGSKDGPLKWDWVYVEDGKVDQARAELLGKPTKSGKKKRKSKTDATPAMGSSLEDVKVVSDEYVVQSLILGELLPYE